jgi:hypothetical protein
MAIPRQAWMAAAFAAILVTGCGKATIGMECSETADCESGLSCLQEQAYDFGTDQCIPGAKYCSFPCSSDVECTNELGPGHICVGFDTFQCPPGLCFEGSSSGG